MTWESRGSLHTTLRNWISITSAMAHSSSHQLVGVAPMIPLPELQKAAADGLAFLRSQQDIEEAEVFVAANGVLLAPLNYPSHIPCNGVEEPKSVVNYGIGVQAVLRGDAGTRRIGFGSETSDISLEGLRSALDKARKGALSDPEVS